MFPREFHPLIEFDELETGDGLIVQLGDAWDRWLLSISGQGLPPINWITDAGPFQDGETPRDFRLKPRILQYVIKWSECSRQEYYDLRRFLLEAVRPNRSTVGGRFAPVKLRKRFPVGTGGPASLYLQAVIDTGPAFVARNLQRWEEHTFNETLRFIAHDPLWIDDTLRSVQSIFTQAQELKFPITFDADHIIFGGGVLDQDLNCITLGSWAVFPTIVLTGPMTDPTITNNTTGESIELDTIIGAGQTVTFDLRYGFKTVVDNTGANLIGSITPESDLADFHLECDPGATGGLNIVNVQASGLSQASQFFLSWQDRYIGF